MITKFECVNINSKDPKAIMNWLKEKRPDLCR